MADYPADLNEDGTVDADDVLQRLTEDAANGISSFSDGQHSVSAIPIKDQIEVHRYLKGQEAAAQGNSGLSLFSRTVRLKSPGAWS